jgi:hypothetical protein
MRNILVIALLSVLMITLIAWKYSGSRELILDAVNHGSLIMTNGSEWQVYELDYYRAVKWERGDRVKIIESKGFYAYEWLGLNLDREDAVHLHCIGDGK